MIKKFLIVSILFCFITAFGQSEKNILLLYKNVIEKSESLLAQGKITEIDTKGLMELIKKLDKEHPSKYFENSMKFFENSKYNESAFLYYLGKMRMADFNKNSKEHYEIGADNEVILQEGIFMFLAIDVDNFGTIIKMSNDYYNNNEYSFISKNKGYQKVKNPTHYDEMLDALQKDKKKIKDELSVAREDMKKRVVEYYPYLESK